MSIREVLDGLREQPPEDPPDDEIIAAIERQLDVLEGTGVALGNLLGMLTLQIRNLREEVALFRTQPQPSPSQPPTPPAQERASGAVSEIGAPGWCGHPDALLIDTVNGPVRVCPDCDDG